MPGIRWLLLPVFGRVWATAVIAPCAIATILNAICVSQGLAGAETTLHWLKTVKNVCGGVGAHEDNLPQLESGLGMMKVK